MDDFQLHFTDQLKVPGFIVSNPDQVTVPFVFNSPHSGRHYTPYFLNQSRLSPLLLRKSEDALVDYMYEFATDLGAPLLSATFPRAYVDVNREPYELDPHLISSPLPSHANSESVRVAAGLGTIARVVGTGLEIYRQQLSLEEALWRIENFYYPYHQALKSLLDEQVSRFNKAILIDCHSMPSSSPSYTSSLRPDIVVGDRFGHSANSEMVTFLIELLSEKGLNVAYNTPYAGGYITEHYGKPNASIHAIQVEIDRSLYMDEVLLEPHSGFSELSEKLENVFQRFVTDVTHSLILNKHAAE